MVDEMSDFLPISSECGLCLLTLCGHSGGPEIGKRFEIKPNVVTTPGSRCKSETERDLSEVMVLVEFAFLLWLCRIFEILVDKVCGLKFSNGIIFHV